MADPEWVRGELSGLQIPAHSQALRAGGESFLTSAFRASGALSAENRVTAITAFEEWAGGSTGRKVRLSVAYDAPGPGLYTELFVKFSRDFTDPVRDAARHQMDAEIRFAAMSRRPCFPIAVPACLFADYQRESGTGMLITQRVEFGTGAIERHYGKCLDVDMPAPLEHYQALMRALARLAGTHKAGLLGEDFNRQFPFDPSTFNVSDRPPYTAAQLARRVGRFAEFASQCPQLLPASLTSQTFLSQLAEEVMRFPGHEPAIKQFLREQQPDLIALCHWNANVDNAWFWRNARGELECGLMDWGHVSQMNVAMALWGCLSAAEIELWDRHLDGLLALFIAEFQRCGGPALDRGELRLHLHLYIAMMGLAWLMDVPGAIQAQVPDLIGIGNRFDPRLKDNETARVRLHMMTTFLHLWQTQEFGTLLERMHTTPTRKG
jgi:hypothetical protein